MEIKRIVSKNNTFYKELVRSGSKTTGYFFVEGARFISSAYEFGGSLPAFLVCSDDREEECTGLLKRLGGEVEMVSLSSQLFREISDTVNSQGILGVYERASYESSLTDMGPSEGGSGRDFTRIVVLDEVQDPGNVGAIIRTADAAGFDLVIAIKGTADPFSQKASRASAGSVLNIPIARAEREEALSWLAAGGSKDGLKSGLKGGFKDGSERRSIDIFVADLEGESYRAVSAEWRDAETKLGEEKPLALVFGNEAHGPHKDFVAAAAEKVSIPMDGGAESLNVSVAAGILIYEFSAIHGE